MSTLCMYRGHVAISPNKDQHLNSHLASSRLGNGSRWHGRFLQQAGAGNSFPTHNISPPNGLKSTRGLEYKWTEM